MLTCKPEHKDALVFTVAVQMLRNGNSEKVIRNYLNNHLGSKTTWELHNGKLVKEPPLGTDAYTLAKKALKGNETLPESGLTPVLSRTNEKTLTDMVRNKEGTFITVSGFRFFKPVKSWAHEWTPGRQNWDIVEKDITPTTIPIRVWGWDKQGRQLEGTNHKKSATLHVDADLWEEHGLANALQHLIDNPKTGKTGISKTTIRTLSRKVQREALSYREGDGARTSQKVLYRDKNPNSQAISKTDLRGIENPPEEETRQENYFNETYDDNLADPRDGTLPSKARDIVHYPSGKSFYTDKFGVRHQLGKEDINGTREHTVSVDGENNFPDHSFQKLEETPPKAQEKSKELLQASTEALDKIPQLTQENTDLANAGWETPAELITDPWDTYLNPDQNPYIEHHKIDTVADGRHGASKSWRFQAYTDKATNKRVLVNPLSDGRGTRLADASTATTNSKGFLIVKNLKWVEASENPRQDIYKMLDGSSVSEAQSKMTAKDLQVRQEAWEEERTYQKEYHPEKLDSWLRNSPSPKSLEPKQTLEQASKTISVLAPSIPRLEGFTPYLEALKDPNEAANALEALILQNSDLAPSYKAAMYELHQQGELSEATLNKLLKGPCS